MYNTYEPNPCQQAIKIYTTSAAFKTEALRVINPITEGTLRWQKLTVNEELNTLCS
jgi:hypothetical protein